ncbi:5-oxoprolinase [Sphingobacterium sp. PCS056]|uniref:5-oxoprolinase n=1 Tax=Sphingobacterium TaxID=28453 RepID=UPI00201077A8|nr:MULTISPECIES: 5-oxoprolinase [unclassified Sphingobacterium]UPZ36884.1 5-oxoprolinase [Sphingobacterium sp. PCS056]
MSTPNLYQHLLEKFSYYTINELIQLNNDTVSEKGWGSSKSTFRTALISTFSKRGLDLSNIISREDGFTSVKYVAVRLEKNTLVPIVQ